VGPRLPPLLVEKMKPRDARLDSEVWAQVKQFG
jgi:hypothetical protein